LISNFNCNYYLRLNINSVDIKLLETFIFKIKENLRINLDEDILKQISIITLPTKIKKYTLLKSPHIFKTAREQFEKKEFKYLVNFSNFSNIEYLNNFIFRLFLLMPPGLDIKISKTIIKK
jgi:small subunit ribosomal protein S10